MSSGKSSGQARNDIDTIGSGTAIASSSNAADVARTAEARTCATEHRGGVVVERFAFVVDWCSRHAGLDELDPPAVDDLVVGRRRHRHGPAEMMGDAQTHATDSARARTSLVDAAF